jgi:hypothetical protein
MKKKTGRTVKANRGGGGAEEQAKVCKAGKATPSGGGDGVRGRGGTTRATRSAAGGRNCEEPSNPRGRKRPRSDSESEDIYNCKVRLLDGRQGVFTRDK